MGEVSLARRNQRQLGGVSLSFILALATAFFMFLPFLVLDKGFFTYAGDFNSQQIPFYYYVQSFLKNWDGGTWSWATDLGGSVITSYSFYNIGSPFLWLLTLLPSSWMPYMMAPVLMLKFALIAAFACLYFQRYAKSRNMAVIAALLYAFCGFNVYNIFFNHMHEPVVLFPLMLWALDEFVYKKRRGVFALLVGLALINNYFFFAGNAVFLLLYFVVKVVYKDYRINGKDFLLLALEVVLGVLLGMALALPSFLSLIQNPRVEEFSDGFGLVLYSRAQQYFAIFASAFLPPDSTYSPNLFTDGAIKWTSMSVYLPFVSMAGVIAYCRGRKKSALKTLIVICIIMAFVPILNSAFYAFNSSYYARWYYMPLLLMCLATMKSLEEAGPKLEKAALVTLGITMAFSIFGILPKKDDEGVYSMGVAQYQSQFWLTMLIATTSALIFYTLVRLGRKSPKFPQKLLAGVLGFSVIYSVVHMAVSKLPQWERDSEYKTYMYDTLRNLELPDEGFYRIDAYELPFDNAGIWMNQSCLYTFNSVVNPVIMEFYPLVGVKRDVSSKPEHEKYYLRGLLSVRFILVPLDKQEEYLGKSFSQGWALYRQEGPVAIYENENYVPLGFTYDKYITLEEFDNATTSARERALLEVIVLSEEQCEQYGHLLTHKDEGLGAYGSYERYAQLCSERRATASYAVETGSWGFSSKIYLEKPNLVFYAVPYDKGFSATVNGVPAEVLKVSGGMMAVAAPAGDNTIVFTYETPGFAPGLALSLAALAVLGVYLLCCFFWRRRVFLLRGHSSRGPRENHRKPPVQ